MPKVSYRTKLWVWGGAERVNKKMKVVKTYTLDEALEKLNEADEFGIENLKWVPITKEFKRGLEYRHDDWLEAVKALDDEMTLSFGNSPKTNEENGGKEALISSKDIYEVANKVKATIKRVIAKYPSIFRTYITSNDDNGIDIIIDFKNQLFGQCLPVKIFIRNTDEERKFIVCLSTADWYSSNEYEEFYDI